MLACGVCTLTHALKKQTRVMHTEAALPAVMPFSMPRSIASVRNKLIICIRRTVVSHNHNMCVTKCTIQPPMHRIGGGRPQPCWPPDSIRREEEARKGSARIRERGAWSTTDREQESGRRTLTGIGARFSKLSTCCTRPTVRFRFVSQSDVPRPGLI